MHLLVLEQGKVFEVAVLLHLEEGLKADAAAEARVVLLLKAEVVREVLSAELAEGGGSAVSDTEVVNLVDLLLAQILYKYSIG